MLPERGVDRSGAERVDADAAVRELTGRDTFEPVIETDGSLESGYANADVVWCQEEPRNMGSWHFIESYLEWVLNQTNAANKRPRYAGRPASAATATGLMSKHLAQLKALLDDALN